MLGQLDFAGRRAVEFEDLDPARHMVQVGQVELAVDDRHALEDVVGFRHDLAPVGNLGPVEIDLHQAVERRVQVRAHEQPAVAVVGVEAGLHAFDDRRRLPGSGLDQVEVAPGPSVLDADEQLRVVELLGADEGPRSDPLAEHQGVLRSIGAEPVEADTRTFDTVADGVVDAAAVLREERLVVQRPGHLEVEVDVLFEVAQADRRFVLAADADVVEQELPVGRNGDDPEVRVLAAGFRRVDDDFVLARRVNPRGSSVGILGRRTTHDGRQLFARPA